MLVGGQVRSTLAGTCDYTQRVPCSNQPGATLQVDTTQIQDGTYPVEIAAVDATAGRPGENVARRQVATVSVDNVPSTTPPDPGQPSGTIDQGTPSSHLDGPSGNPTTTRSLPILSLGRLSVTGRRRIVSGRLDPDASGAVAVELSARIRGKKVRVVHRTTPRPAGRFEIAVPRRLAGGRRLTVLVSFPGDSRHLPRRIRKTYRLP